MDAFTIRALYIGATIVLIDSSFAGVILAPRQGRSQWFDAALGLGLNLVGVLIVTLIPTDRSMLLLKLSLSSRVALPPLEMEVGKCRSCGAALHSADRFCSQSGTPVASSP